MGLSKFFRVLQYFGHLYANNHEETASDAAVTKSAVRQAAQKTCGAVKHIVSWIILHKEAQGNDPRNHRLIEHPINACGNRAELIFRPPLQMHDIIRKQPPQISLVDCADDIHSAETHKKNHSPNPLAPVPCF